ncbi:MAG TPA: hypothetical protein VGC21_02955 [Telluria sp.]
MKENTLAVIALRARLFLMARGAVLCGACVLLLGAGAALAWLLPQSALQAREQQVALRLIKQGNGPLVRAAPVSASNNLALFYGALGEKRYAEQQVKTLFALAGKAGVVLNQGEYKAAYDRNARLYTYQVTLPVKGSYNDVSKFSLMALRTIPFASLDELSFKRENIGETQVEARVRLTLFLAGESGAVR